MYVDGVRTHGWTGHSIAYQLMNTDSDNNENY